MFNWAGCPPELYNLYIEVGEVKISSVRSDTCVFIEVWVASNYQDNRGRIECEKPVRRPIYAVFKQIQRLCGDRPACVVIMCNDVGVDTLDWGVSLSLLLWQLNKENRVKHTMLYTKKTKEQVEAMPEADLWRSEKDKELVRSLINTVDVFVYEQANCYSNNESAKDQTKNLQPPSLLCEFIDFFK